MAIMGILPCGLLGTFFLLSSSFIPSAFSDSSFEVQVQQRSRRALMGAPQSIIQLYLVPHNQLRASLGLPPMRWSSKLADFATGWANQRRGDCAMIHSSSKYGENIFWGAGNKWGPADAVAAWASERRYYNYGSNSCMPNRDCTHYTQMVWRSSTSIGCAMAVCVNGDTFIICDYDPHGNVIGQIPY